MAGAALTKTQIVTSLAEATGISKKLSAQYLESLSALAIKETKRTGQFTLPGLGKLVKQQRKARVGRNPQTGESIKIPAKTVVKFRVAKAAKDTIAPAKK